MLIKYLAITLSLVLSGCASNGSVQSEIIGSQSPLAYYQMLSRMTSAELGRERIVLAALPSSPNTQVRQAMLFGHPRAQLDMVRAMSLLDAVIKSTDPAAIALQPLAKLLADNYAERQKVEAHLERQGAQLKESQRKALELQEKIDGLADIERTLPQRPRATRPVATGGNK